VLKAGRQFALATLLLVALGNVQSFAQGCAMCRANAKATPKDGQRAINRAVFVMLVPPVGIMVLGFAAAVRYGKRRDEEKDNQD